MIMSRLDCCSATFSGVVDGQIVHIQMIQNKAAKPIFKKKNRSKWQLQLFVTSCAKDYEGHSPA